MGQKKKKDKRSKRNGKTMAQLADKFDLYQRSVQAPEEDCKFFERVFKKTYGRPPKMLREDFCAAAYLSCTWAARSKDHQAVGYDIDPQPLDWGREHNLAAIKPAARERVQLLVGDARKVHGPKADVISAQNFSFFFFKTRAELLEYFKAARQNLADEGLLVLDMMGGYESYEENREEITKYKGYKYVWDTVRFDPINHDCLFHIHFRFKDGSELKKAFTYDWRFWTIPEVRELLAEAGFARSEVYWEGTDQDGDGNGVFSKRESAPSDPAWICYLVGVK